MAVEDTKQDLTDVFSTKRGFKLVADGLFYIPPESITVLYTIIISLILTDEEFYKDSIISIGLSIVYFFTSMFSGSFLKYNKKTYVGAKLVTTIILIYGLILAFILKSPSVMLFAIEANYVMFRDIVASDLLRSGKRYHHLYYVRGVPMTVVAYISWFIYGYKFSLEELLSLYAITDLIANSVLIYFSNKRFILEMYLYKASLKEEFINLKRTFLVSTKDFYILIINAVYKLFISHTGDSTGLLKQYRVLFDFRNVIVSSMRVPVTNYIKYVSTRYKQVVYKLYIPYVVTSSLIFTVVISVYSYLNNFNLLLTLIMFIRVPLLSFTSMLVYIYDCKLMLNKRNNLKLFIATVIDIVPTIIIQMVIPNLYAPLLLVLVTYPASMLYLRRAYIKDEDNINRLIDKNIKAEL